MSASRITKLMALLTVCSAPWAQPARGVCVGGEGCFTSIQEAVNAAQPSDVISIRPGTYHEQIDVPLVKTGITLAGSASKPAAVVIDCSNFAQGDAVVVSAPGVTLRDFLVRRSPGNGITFKATASHSRVANVQLVSPAHDGIAIDAEDVLVERNKVIASGNNGIDVKAARAVIRDSTVSGSHGICIQIQGDSAAISDNTIFGSKSGACIQAVGDNVHVDHNRIKSCAGRGIEVRGDAPLVKGNTVSDSQAEGVRVDCGRNGTCTRGLVSSNVVRDIAENACFDLSAATAGLIARDNSAMHCGAAGFLISGAGLRLEGNESSDNGLYKTSAGFAVDGTLHSLAKNMASKNSGDGFVLRGAGHVLELNWAQGNRGNGYNVKLRETAGAKLSKNAAADNALVGFAVRTGTVNAALSGNISTGNGTDYCDAGSGTTETQDAFGTIGGCRHD